MNGPALRARTAPLGGFTLIEILMALMVLTVGLASVLSIFVHGVRSSRDVVDESAATLSASAVLARILSEDGDDSHQADGERDYLAIIEHARRQKGADWVWVHDKDKPFSGKVGAEVKPEDIPAPVPVAEGSVYSWRCRASRYRSAPRNNPDGTADLRLRKGDYVPLQKGRVSQNQEKNPDSDEFWRLTIQVFRDYKFNPGPLATFQMFVCTAHR